MDLPLVEFEKDMEKGNDALGAFGLATGIKEYLIQGAVATNRGISISRVNC